MKVISFTFTSNDFEYAVLSGSKDKPKLESKNKLNLPANYDTPKLTGWFEAELNLILNQVDPDLITYRLTISNVTNNYVATVYYGQAILNLLCNRKNKPIKHTSPVSLKPTKIGLPKDTNLHDHLENLIGKQPAPWDKGMKDTVVAALINMD